MELTSEERQAVEQGDVLKYVIPGSHVGCSVVREDLLDPLNMRKDADDELIHAGGRTYAFTNQWGDGAASAINSLIQAFPQHPITCVKSEGET